VHPSALEVHDAVRLTRVDMVPEWVPVQTRGSAISGFLFGFTAAIALGAWLYVLLS
jgi:hypothetical protein